MLISQYFTIEKLLLSIRYQGRAAASSCHCWSRASVLPLTNKRLRSLVKNAKNAVAAASYSTRASQTQSCHISIQTAAWSDWEIYTSLPCARRIHLPTMLGLGAYESSSEDEAPVAAPQPKVKV